ncbi:hypothetical protein GQ53DRAFT_837983 [Thozetella sp. PMI_491]|nr:hypothetical protein GQ53DRAFT_837983 [Thozetella sp. PMI_491]
MTRCFDSVFSSSLRLGLVHDCGKHIQQSFTMTLSRRDGGESDTTMAVSGFVIGLAIVTCVLRFYTRRFTRQNIGVDDWLILVSVTTMLITAALLLWGNSIDPNGLAMSESTDPSYIYTPEDNLYLKISLVCSTLYYTITGSSKLGILCMYHRIFWVSDGFRRQLWVSMALVLGFWIGCTVATLTNCIPLEWSWINTLADPRYCINYNIFWMASGIVEMVLDIVILTLPIQAVAHMQLSLRRKLTVASIFLLGGFVIITGLLKVILGYSRTGRVPSYSNTEVWATVHAAMTIVCASLPIFKPLVSRFASWQGWRLFAITSHKLSIKKSEKDSGPHSITWSVVHGTLRHIDSTTSSSQGDDLQSATPEVILTLPPMVEFDHSESSQRRGLDAESEVQSSQREPMIDDAGAEVGDSEALSRRQVCPILATPEVVAKVNAFVAQLNETEKAGIVTGSFKIPRCIGNIDPIERLGFKGICYADGPLGINRADLNSVFPAGITTAATWDRDLMYRRGVAIGEEFRGKGAHVFLGPVAGPLGRHPLGGRNWEGFSPDPYLSGIAMDATVRGVQSVGVQSCAKHYIGNEQETRRSITQAPDGTELEAVSSDIDDRTLRELYLWPFVDAVKAGTSSIMCSYNRINGTYGCENDALLNHILKGDLGFEGYVVSDWFATHSTAPAANGGLDMSMPGPIDVAGIFTSSDWFGLNLTTAVHDGKVSAGRVDDMVRRVLLPYFALGQDENYPDVDPTTPVMLLVNQGGDPASLGFGTNVTAVDVRSNHASLIREIGAAAITLLKNENGTLPLKTPMNIGVFGNDAADPTDGLSTPIAAELGSDNFVIGTLDVGGGSGSARHTNLISPLQAIRERARTYGARVQYVTNNDRLAADDWHTIFPIPEVCLVFLKTYASEGMDRTAFENDWNSTLVVENAAKRCSNTIVITHSAGVNTLPWAGNPNVKAIIAAHLPGEETGNSLVDVLFGDVNPSGKLPYTIPANESDYNVPVLNNTSNNPSETHEKFEEGLFIDYRHFDSKNITPLYEFGFGLSYTTFDMPGKLDIDTLNAVSAFPDASKSVVPGGNPDHFTPVLCLALTVRNTGSVGGATVAQLYVSLPESSAPSGTPIKVLRGFEKVYLEPGETQQVTIQLARRDLSYWDVMAQEWRIPEGNFTFSAGFSSRDLKQTTQHAVL